MSVGRTLAVVLLSVLLTVTLFGATVTAGVDRTALNEEYVTQRFEDEQVDSELASEFRTDIATEVNGSGEQQPLPTGIAIDLDGDRIANQSVTDEFVRTELRRNVGTIIGYLRGDSDEINLTTNLRPVKASVRGELMNATKIDTPLLVGTNSDRIDSQRVARLNESEQEYRDAQIELSESERAEIESEIEKSVRQQLSNDSEELTTAVIDHQRTVLDGLTGELSYDEYVEQLAADERAIKAAIADVALSEFPNEQSVLGEDSDPESELEPVRSGTKLIVLVAWLSWLLAAALIGGIYLVTRSIDRTATAAGTGLAVAGLLGAVLGFVLGPVLKDTVGLGGGDPNPIVAGLIAVVDGTLQTIGTQSLALLIAGGLVLIVVAADRRGLFDGVREQLGYGPRN